MSTFFISGKSSVINGVRKLSKPPSWLITFTVIPLSKIPLLSIKT